MFVTSNPSPEQLNEYYKLRYESFSQRLNLVDYHQDADAIDKQVTTLLVIDDEGRCLAGAQVYCRMSQDDLLTPFEQKEGIPMPLAFPYGETLRLAIRLDYHPKRSMVELLLSECVKHLRQANCRAFFFYTSRGHGVLYNRALQKMQLNLVADPELNKSIKQYYKNTISVLYTCRLP